METKYTLNSAPALTWNWLKSNCDEITVNATFVQEDLKYDSLPKGVSKKDLAELDVTKKSALTNIPNGKFGDTVKSAQNARITTAAKISSEEIEKLISGTVKSQQEFIIEGKVEEPIVFTLDTEKDSICKHSIIAKEDSEATVILLYKGNPSNQLVQTTVKAFENAKINIIKVQLLDSNSTQLDDTQIYEADNAMVKFIQLELGAQHVDSGLYVELNGYQSKFNSKVSYLCQNNQYLDMNHIVYHFGKKSECNMQVNGTIKDEAVKNYRGTIDFKNGCCGAKGNEMEETLILSQKAVNKSLPVILCDEEDVEGEHGATIGRLSNDILFYMQSRGIDEKSAEQIMARAKIQAVTDLIPSEDVRNLITEWIENK